MHCVQGNWQPLSMLQGPVTPESCCHNSQACSVKKSIPVNETGHPANNMMDDMQPHPDFAAANVNSRTSRHEGGPLNFSPLRRFAVLVSQHAGHQHRRASNPQLGTRFSYLHPGLPACPTSTWLLTLSMPVVSSTMLAVKVLLPPCWQSKCCCQHAAAMTVAMLCVVISSIPFTDKKLGESMSREHAIALMVCGIASDAEGKQRQGSMRPWHKYTCGLCQSNATGFSGTSQMQGRLQT